MTMLQSRPWSPPPVVRPESEPPAPERTDIRPGSAQDLEAMTTFLSGLSAETLYKRFLTGLGQVMPPGLPRQLLVPGATGGSLLAVRGAAVIGHAMWAPVPTADDPSGASTVEIALVVADDHQGQGLGSRLVDALVDDVSGHGFAHVHAVVSAENHVVRRMITRRVSDARYGRDGALITVTADARSLAPRRSWPRGASTAR
ncbi:GNAT family N-acetyltransferase [Mumia zhuanghuii]|uniref:GNAT family N-acetyltransferase n=2 Tax=Mumia TaxID=1546255 RepID=A0ABW1QHK0_9ACTN|nr:MULTISPECIES: GNAT family N-acetyltransferase [Mumia]KAA1418184.1 GNAT family N-acetyltransferase [Mumia zhuanghuii]